MKPNNVRYGNYVVVTDRCNKLARVSNTTKQKIGYHLADAESYMHYAIWQYVEPVAVTEKTFLLFGFELQDMTNVKVPNYSVVYLYKDEDLMMTISKDDVHNCYLFNGYRISDESRISKRFSHMHELQNMMSDLNYEKKIKFEDVIKCYE